MVWERSLGVVQLIRDLDVRKNVPSKQVEECGLHPTQAFPSKREIKPEQLEMEIFSG